jgi:Xaa-Pro aminopeptidase
MRNDQSAACFAALVEALGAGPCQARRIGCEFSAFPHHWPLADRTHLIDMEPELYRLRRRKDPDELILLRRALSATQRMYEAAREIVEPGVSELDVFSQLQSVAVDELGQPLTATGNDYQCGQRGGAPRPRTIEAGELYILDLGPAYRGYFADNARTLAVTEPSAAQVAAWQAVVDVFATVENWVRPGASARGLFQEVQRQLDDADLGVFNHHLGHGIGLFPHEAPHLNPHWDDQFEVGDVFAAEPGLYAPELRSGIRLENDYLVTDEGVELLTPFPLGL